ncbi:metallophosphoesterase [Bacillus sp. REN3]|uniref:metallophosphoesterase n=1 Tax=Bacillus sp. REN3 TaxID=2802440 RepID=UPI001AEE6FB4|nr:metallophosphoesterase [Bacillus sp. REN3]
MFNGLKTKQKLRIYLKGLAAASALTISLAAFNPTTSALAKTEEKPKFTIGIVPDIQYCDCNVNGTRFYRNSIDKLMEASQTFNEQDVDFTVQTGDLIDRNVSSFSTILPYFNTIEGPKYHLLGNHDFPVTTDQVVDILGMPNQYYDFKYKNWRFIALDPNDLSLYANSAGSEKFQQAQKMYTSLKEKNAINAQTWNGGVSEEQLKWLHGVLEKAAKSQEKVVVFSHMPVYPANEHNVWNSEAVMAELEAAGNVVAYINGHNHAGNYEYKNGIHYLNLKGMVETADTNAYSILKVYKDRLEVDGFGRETDRTLTIR